MNDSGGRDVQMPHFPTLLQHSNKRVVMVLQFHILPQDYQALSYYNMQDGRARSVKMPALTHKKRREGREDWKINGVCDWQPMILGIRLNWIREKESAGHNPCGARDTLILNIQEHFPSSPSQSYKAWSQNTLSPLETDSLKGFKSKPAQAFGRQPASSRIWKKLATCWQHVKRQIFLSTDSVKAVLSLNITDTLSDRHAHRWVNFKTKQWTNRKPEYVVTQPWMGNVISWQYTMSSSQTTDVCIMDGNLAQSPVNAAQKKNGH